MPVAAELHVFKLVALNACCEAEAMSGPVFPCARGGIEPFVKWHCQELTKAAFDGWWDPKHQLFNQSPTTMVTLTPWC